MNPLGEAGARSLFRCILKGLRCFVMMRECTYHIDDKVFNHTHPTMESPYTLNMSIPYDAAVLTELSNMAASDPTNCKIDSIGYRETSKSGEAGVGVMVDRGEVLLKTTGAKWIPPTTGTIKIHFSKTTAMPTRDKAIDMQSLQVSE